MFKKIILLFLISFAWQLNLFSMHAKSEIENIYSFDTKCAKCGSVLSFNEQTDYSYFFKCSNEDCQQRHWMRRQNLATVESQKLQSNRDNEKSINNNDRSKINSISAYPKLKYYLMSVAVVCLVIWKYSNQIKKFLFRK